MPKGLIYFTLGTLILISGIALILLWWPQVVALFKGGIGIMLALVGLVIMYTVRR